MDFSKYKIDDLVGCGSGGSVYKLYKNTEEIKYCIKLIKCIDEEDILSKLENIHTCQKLSHKHIVKIFDYGRIDYDLAKSTYHFEDRINYDVDTDTSADSDTDYSDDNYSLSSVPDISDLMKSIYKKMKYGVYVIMGYLDEYQTLCSICPVTEATCKRLAKKLIEIISYIDSANIINYDFALRNIMIKTENNKIIDIKLIDPESYIDYNKINTWKGESVKKFIYTVRIQGYREIDFFLNDDYCGLTIPELINGIIHPNTMSWSFGVLIFELLFGTEYSIKKYDDCEKFANFVIDKLDMYENFRDIVNKILIIDANDRLSVDRLKEYIDNLL